MSLFVADCWPHGFIEHVKVRGTDKKLRLLSALDYAAQDSDRAGLHRLLRAVNKENGVGYIKALRKGSRQMLVQFGDVSNSLPIHQNQLRVLIAPRGFETSSDSDAFDQRREQSAEVAPVVIRELLDDFNERLTVICLKDPMGWPLRAIVERGP